MASIAPLEKFTLFPKLPIELRLKIWVEAAQQGRVIEVQTRRIRGKPKKSWTESVAPAVFHACRDSRHEALKFYQLLKAKNDCYDPDDGLEADAGEAGKHWDWNGSHYNTYIPTPGDEVDREPLGVNKFDICPTFRAYIGPHDILYVSTRHSCDVRGFLSTLWDDTTIPHIAIDAEPYLVDDPHNYPNYFGHLLTITLNIWLAIGDVCCRDIRGHRKAVNNTEGSPEATNEELVQKVKAEINDMTSSFFKKDMPEIRFAVVQRVD